MAAAACIFFSYFPGLLDKGQFNVEIGRHLYTAFLGLSALPCLGVRAFAAKPINIWDKASEIMKDVYGQAVAISTIAAIVTASIALLLMNFSKSGHTVDESRAWLKRIIITWAIIDGLGFIIVMHAIVYIEHLFRQV